MPDWGFFVLGLVIIGFVINRIFIEIGIIIEAYTGGGLGGVIGVEIYRLVKLVLIVGAIAIVIKSCTGDDYETIGQADSLNEINDCNKSIGTSTFPCAVPKKEVCDNPFLSYGKVPEDNYNCRKVTEEGCTLILVDVNSDTGDVSTSLICEDT